MLTAAAALALATACAPSVAPSTLLSVAFAESHWEPLAIHDNLTGGTILLASRPEAADIAARLIAEGHNPDLGLLQINAANLVRTGLTIETAFDPCASMRAGAQILADGYQGGATTAAQQAALLRALSAYNTGSPTAGLRTYAPLVLAAARRVVPALRVAGLADAPAGASPRPPPPPRSDPFVTEAPDSASSLSFPVQESKP